MTVNVPFTVTPHPIQGGGFWAEIEELPGCVAQAETLEELEARLIEAALDWMQDAPVKTEQEALELAKLQGRGHAVGGPYPEPYPYLPPPEGADEYE